MGRRAATTTAKIPRLMITVLACVLAACAASTGPSNTTPPPPIELAAPQATRFAELALACVHRPYPSKVAHVLASDEDAQPPATLTPAFYGCFDWHSAVHGHWLLARLTRRFPEAAFVAEARRVLAQSLTLDKLIAEAQYVGRPDRVGFERPYGLAWALALSAELRGWDDPEAKTWATNIRALEAVAAARLRAWLPKLSHPIRSGEHSQTAFALGLAIDWARATGSEDFEAAFVQETQRLYAKDTACPIGYEPSGHDFLSPCLAEADLMRRVLDADAFAKWLRDFLPEIPDDGTENWIAPAVPTDRKDGKIVHLDGLNLSRAWMLDGIAEGLPAADPRRASILAAAGRHADLGLAAVTGDDYAGGHWLASFAVYLTTRRGVSKAPE